MARPGEVVIKILGDSKGLNSTLGSAEGKLGKFAKGAAVGLAGLATVGAAVGGALFAIGSEFDKASDTIRVGTGATGEQLKALEEDFKKVATTVPSSLGDASTAVADLNTRLGLTGEPLQEMSTQFLNLARITGEQVGPLIAAGTRVLGDFSVAAEDQAGALDHVFKASQATGIGVTELTDKMVQFGAPLRQLGFDFETSAALLGKWEKEGVNTEAVLAGMKAGLGKMAKAGEEPIEALKRLTTEMKNAGTQGEANAIAVEAFGTRAGPDMAAAVREGRFELDDLMSSLSGSSETIQKAADDTESFGEKWQVIKNRVLVALEPVATRVFDKMGELMDQLGPVIETVVGAFRAFFAAFKAGDGDVTSSGLAGWFERLGNTVRVIFDTVTGVVNRFRKMWATNTGDVQGKAAAMRNTLSEIWAQVQEILATAAEAIVVIIQTLVKIGTAIWERFGKHIVRFIKEAWNNVMQVVKGALNVIKGVLDLFIGIFTGDWSRAWGGIQKIVSGAWNMIQGLFRQALNVIRTLLGAGVAALAAIFRTGWNAIQTFFKATIGELLGKARDGFNSIKDAVRERIAGVVDFVRGLPGRITGALGKLGRLLWNAGVDILKGLLDGLKHQWNNVSGWVGGLGDKIKNLKGPIEKDRVLLTAEGGAIIDGLGKGMKAEWSQVQRLLKGFTGEISGTEFGTPGVTRPAAASTGGGSGQEALLERLLQAIEKMGGKSVTINAPRDASSQELAEQLAWTLATQR